MTQDIRIVVTEEHYPLTLRAASSPQIIEIALAQEHYPLTLRAASSPQIIEIALAQGTGEAANDSFSLSWAQLVTQWAQGPSLVNTIPGGEVYAYLYGGVTRYRFVPSPYSPGADAFYSAFNGSDLSGLITTRSS